MAFPHCGGFVVTHEQKSDRCSKCRRRIGRGTIRIPERWR